MAKGAKEYLNNLLEKYHKLYEDMPEFIQAVDELLASLEEYLDENPHIIEKNIVELIIEPERVIKFKVPWQDDNGNWQVNRGYRVQFNSALGPYKGGLRFHPTVTESVVRFLGFEQNFKNALTNLPIGGGKGGSDFDPKGKSEAEIMRFAQSFMTELQKYIGPDTDVPAGDIGVGGREIGYMFGQYKKLNNYQNGVLTGKPIPLGGSLGRTEATGYGTVFFLTHMLASRNQHLKGQRVIVSGAGNVATYAIEKAQELGANVLTASNSKGFIVDEEADLDVHLLRELKEKGEPTLEAYAEQVDTASYYEGSVWDFEIQADVALPCATQNEINEVQAKTLVGNQVKYIAEGANMPINSDGTHYLLDQGVYIGPGKAANAGGVAVSALEMSQNSQRLSWTSEEVIEKLEDIMETIFNNVSQAAAQYGHEENLIYGANVAGFEKVAEAMILQGLV